jgi:1-phosphofructokinase family hexose kinase
LIYTLTLNPAVDKVLFLEEFQPAHTTRLSRSLETIGGKGTHVSINLHLLGVESTALGIALGATGRRIGQMLQEWGVRPDFLHYDLAGMESRTNYELVETKSRRCTMLTERGPTLPTSVTADLLEQVRRLLKAGDVLVLAGDANNVEDTAIYSHLAQAANDAGARVCLDASGPYLRDGLASRPYLIKPNHEELCFLAGRELETEAEVVAALQELDQFGIQVVAMTWASRGAIVKVGQELYRLHPFKVEVVNEAGCGDAFLAALVAGMEQGAPIEETLRTASAVAAATAETETTVGFDVRRVETLKQSARVEKIQ